jgi:hypothetical protein
MYRKVHLIKIADITTKTVMVVCDCGNYKLKLPLL